MLAVELRKGFKEPQIDKYDGSTDPMDHATSYHYAMRRAGYSDVEQCWGFLAALIGPARQWFQDLPQRFIATYQDLARKFVDQFHYSCVNRKIKTYLMSVKQKPDGDNLRLAESLAGVLCYIDERAQKDVHHQH